MRFRLALDQLVKAEKDDHRVKPTQQIRTGGIARPDSFQIDLRGKRVDEALDEVTRFLDRSLLAGLTSVHILHGKGTGALQEAIREYLRTLNFIKSFEYARPEQGGAGITIAEFT